MTQIPDDCRVKWLFSFCDGELGAVLPKDRHVYSTIFEQIDVPLVFGDDDVTVAIASFADLCMVCHERHKDLEVESQKVLGRFCDFVLNLYGHGRVLTGELGEAIYSLYCGGRSVKVEPEWSGGKLRFFAEQAGSEPWARRLVRVSCEVGGEVAVEVVAES